MSYLETYGVKDARRERIFRLLAVLTAVAVIGGTIMYFWLRDRREKQIVESFLEHLRRGEYKAAHALWGCTDEKPCRDYDYERFLEDWGPNSRQAKVSEVHIRRNRHCDGGIISFLVFPDKHEVNLWVEREDGLIGFAPWPVCNPRMKEP